MKRKIIVIDDDRDVRIGLSAWLSGEYRVQAFAAAEDFLDCPLAIKECDCLLLDLRMPGMSGDALQDKFMNSDFMAPIVFMSGDARKADIIAAWRSGAYDFILKPFSPEEISDALKKVFATISARTSGKVPDRLPISKREAQVLLLLGEGLQQQEIAVRLGLSRRTVKMYRGFLKNKLGLGSMLEIGKFFDRYRDIIARQAEAMDN